MKNYQQYQDNTSRQEERAVAVTLSQFDEAMRKRNGGGGGGPEDDSLLSSQWKKWAEAVIVEKLDGIKACFNALGRYETPMQLAEEQSFQRMLDRVKQSAHTAKQAVLDHSPSLNGSAIGTFLKPVVSRIPAL